MNKVKIVSGWSNPGGSTLHHISLCNLLNDNGFDCTFYGPNEWHLDKCNAKKLDTSFSTTEDDIIISHFLLIPKNIKCKKHILSIHETILFPLEGRDLSHYDYIQYVSEHQREYHSVDTPYVIIPPVVDKIKWTNPNNKKAGIIGSIDQNKQVHLSIKEALKQGYEEVLIFGDITDLSYYNSEIHHLTVSNKVIFMGHTLDKEKMYNQVEKVFHSSKSETYGLVKAECIKAGIPFQELAPISDDITILEAEEILAKWKEILL